MDLVRLVTDRNMSGRPNMNQDIPVLEHFNLDGKRALVIGSEFPAGGEIAKTYAVAGADVQSRENPYEIIPGKAASKCNDDPMRM